MIQSPEQIKLRYDGSVLFFAKKVNLYNVRTAKIVFMLVKTTIGKV
jgi:hypothetical protein